MDTLINQRVKVTIDNQVAYVQLHRPEKRNSLDMAMFKALASAQKLIRKNSRVRAVIITGAGKDFCSGLDVKSVLTNKFTPVKLLWKWLPGNANLAQKVSVGWRRLPVPVIAVIHGHCWGGGMQLALGADFRIADSNSSLSVMEGRWGLIPDMSGNLGMRDCMSKDQAMLLSMTADEISAQEALQHNLVTKVSDNPLAEAEALAATIIERSPDSIKAVKKLYHKRWQDFDRPMLANETLAQWKIILGKNQSIAVKRQQGKNIPYKD